LSHAEITLARSKIHISANEFARQAGWTATYQYKLEDGSVKSITSEVAETILEVFLRFGYYTADEL
jgi:predicted transcriptional regulator